MRPETTEYFTRVTNIKICDYAKIKNIKISEYDKYKEPTYGVNIVSTEKCLNNLADEVQMVIGRVCKYPTCHGGDKNMNYIQLNWRSKNSVDFAMHFTS
jgi:hypothetical protein